MRDDGGRRVAHAGVDHELNAIAGKDLQGCVVGWLRKGVGIHAHEERSVNTCHFAILSDRLADS